MVRFLRNRTVLLHFLLYVNSGFDSKKCRFYHIKMQFLRVEIQLSNTIFNSVYFMEKV